jgi:hypothetical protein
MATTTGFIASSNAGDDVDDERDQQNQEAELLRTRHRGGVSL